MKTPGFTATAALGPATRFYRSSRPAGHTHAIIPSQVHAQQEMLDDDMTGTDIEMDEDADTEEGNDVEAEEESPMTESSEPTTEDENTA